MSYSTTVLGSWVDISITQRCSVLIQCSSLPENLWAALISSEKALNSAGVWRIKNDKFRLFFSIFSQFSDVPQFWGKFWFSTQFAKESGQQKFTVQSFTGRRYNKNSKFWVSFYCSSNKADMVQTFKNTFPFSGMNFQDYFAKVEFLLSFCKFLGGIYFAF